MLVWLVVVHGTVREEVDNRRPVRESNREQQAAGRFEHTQQYFYTNSAHARLLPGTVAAWNGARQRWRRMFLQNNTVLCLCVWLSHVPIVWYSKYYITAFEEELITFLAVSLLPQIPLSSALFRRCSILIPKQFARSRYLTTSRTIAKTHSNQRESRVQWSLGVMEGPGGL